MNILSDGIESCSVELERHKQKNLIIGCIYRHPKRNRGLFLDTLKAQLENLNSKGREILVFGDINENFLRYNDDKQTSEDLDMLLGLGLLTSITKATRITDHTSSLIDHIYTNTPEKVIKPEKSALLMFLTTFQRFVLWPELYLLLMSRSIKF